MLPTPHDSLFKAVFSQPRHARRVLRSVLPVAIVRHLDFRTLRLQSGSFVDEALRARLSDLLFSIRCDGHPALLYVLFEHQSSDDALMPFRLLRYMTDIWTEFLRKHPEATRLPAVIPVVLHHGQDGWRAATTMSELYDLPTEGPAVYEALAPYLPAFRFLLDDVSAQTDEELRRRSLGALPTLVLWAFKHARHEDDMIAAMQKVSDLVRAVYLAPRGVQALATVLRYIMEVSDTNPGKMMRFLQTEIDPMAHQTLITTAERLRREGRKQGSQAMLQKLLTYRFGPLPENVQAQLAVADVDLIDIWARRVLSASSLEEVFAPAAAPEQP